MSAIRIPEEVWFRVYSHLYSKPGEHFAFMLASWTYSDAKPVFMVKDVILVPDQKVKVNRTGWEMATDEILRVVNAAVRGNQALIEVHNHGGVRPRFSPTDREGLQEFPAYVLDSLPGRPYGATVWGDSTVYAEFFLPTGGTGIVKSVTVIGKQLNQVVSRDDDDGPVPTCFNRQLPWFTPTGQIKLARLRVGVVGNGGTGSQLIQNLVFLGIRDFVLVDDDEADQTNMNRLVTATAADLETPKAIIARRRIRSVSPSTQVDVIHAKVQSTKALNTLKGTDIIFGCVDNDGARLILNELALAYCIPYFDLAVGIDAEAGKVAMAGGRLAVVLPGGPCLNCMEEINREESAFFLSTPEEQVLKIARGYVRGMDIKAPSVVSLNAAVAAAALNEFAVFVSGLRDVNPFTELDLLGVGRSVKSQWLTPKQVKNKSGCVQCAIAGTGDQVCIYRYALAVT